MNQYARQAPTRLLPSLVSCWPQPLQLFCPCCWSVSSGGWNVSSGCLNSWSSYFFDLYLVLALPVGVKQGSIFRSKTKCLPFPKFFPFCNMHICTFHAFLSPIFAPLAFILPVQLQFSLFRFLFFLLDFPLFHILFSPQMPSVDIFPSPGGGGAVSPHTPLALD